ncbi:hypothetical protein DPEC_G00303910 [Dallia pectoralis]|uniref:Uncharacterized protein n=1 Tax=Dallia pectoralis TaxID=75939 RepID=A0ACC2FD95_DALPE|nr:hypothetical protein DPEC_G00303910 [Dallia pectoralis]
MKLSVSRMAELAGFPSRHSARSKGKMMGVSTSSSAGTQPNDVNKDGGALLPLATVAVKPPKFNGQGKWKVFFTQFELLANAGRWSDETKALQLALCLTEEASECLLTLAPGGRADYRALVEALGDRFGSDSQPNTLRIELGNRKTLPGPVVVVGRTTVGDFCNIRIKVEGVECLALVDTGSTVTLVRPDILPSGVRVEQTDVQLRTVTGELAPMLGKCRLSVTVGGKTVLCSMWVAAVQDPCILGMDFLKNCGAQLDLAAGTLRLLGGLTVGMLPSGGLAGNREDIPVVPSQQLSPAATPFTPLISTSTGSLGAQNTQAPSPKLTRSGGEKNIKAVEAVWL